MDHFLENVLCDFRIRLKVVVDKVSDTSNDHSQLEAIV